MKIRIMNDETFLSNDGKKFGGMRISYHRFLRACTFLIAQRFYKAIT